VVMDMAGRGLQVRQVIQSPITGHAGNTEFLALV
jgi:predicted rRNA methylase YqxC with S4 and FtsJ domains